jgi:hypothetical protein
MGDPCEVMAKAWRRCGCRTRSSKRIPKGIIERYAERKALILGIHMLPPDMSLLC